jgi:hypothetical protein
MKLGVLKQLILISLVKKVHAYMESECVYHLPLGPIVIQLIPIHIFQQTATIPRSFNWSLPLTLSNHNFVSSVVSMRATSPAHLGLTYSVLPT